MKINGFFLSFSLMTAVLLINLHAVEAQIKENSLPSFSWEHIQRYMHVRKDTAFTPEEIQYLASFPLVTFEKTTGHKDFGSTEEGTLAAARAVKKVNPKTKVLYYRNVIVNYGTYAEGATLKELKDALLKGRDGSDKLVRGRVQAYDLSNEETRNWWLTGAKKICSDPSIDGLMLDGNVKVLETSYLSKEVGKEKKAAVLEGYKTMMSDLRRVLGPEKILLANVIRARFSDGGIAALQAFNGSYIEGFETTVDGIPLKDYVAKGIEAFQKAAQAGFMVTFTAGLGLEDDDAGNNPEKTDEIRKSVANEDEASRRFQYVLGIFLVCAEKYSYIYPRDGYDAKSSKTWMRNPPEFSRPLGEPKGPAIRTGYTYKREFEHASVYLDLESKTAKIDWK